MRQERVTLSREELKRVKVLERLSSGSMTNGEAASVLGVTCRQMSHLKSKYAQEGSAVQEIRDVGREAQNRGQQERPPADRIQFSFIRNASTSGRF